MILSVDKLSCGYDARVVIKDFSVSVKSGEILCLLGPNGIGKTTLFKTILGLLPAKSGTIHLDGTPVKSMSKTDFAKRVSYVPQAHVPPFPFKVMDVVLMGRAAYIGRFGSPGKKDIAVAEHCLENMGISFLKDRTYTELSGGERQMVLIARALSQEPELLMMDEPTSALDFGNSVHVLQHVNRLSKESNMAIIMTTHVPDHAFYCNSKVAILSDGEKSYEGDAKDIITSEIMQDIYGVDIRVIQKEIDGKMFSACIPII